MNAQRKKAGLIIFLLFSLRNDIFLPLLCEREEKFFAAKKQDTAIHHSDELFFLKWESATVAAIKCFVLEISFKRLRTSKNSNLV